LVEKLEVITDQTCAQKWKIPKVTCFICIFEQILMDKIIPSCGKGRLNNRALILLFESLVKLLHFIVISNQGFTGILDQLTLYARCCVKLIIVYLAFGSRQVF